MKSIYSILVILFAMAVFPNIGISQCPSITGFTSLGQFGSSCYYKSNSNFTWANANANALTNGGQLVAINSATENAFLLSNHTAPDPWIGFNDVAVEGTWAWSNGESVSYVNWQVGEPNGGTTSNGAEFWDIGTWNDAPSSTPKPYLLEVPVVPQCDPITGFTALGQFGGKCYYRSNSTFTWPNANTNAQANGGQLVAINSAEENAFILSTHSSPDPWIGFNDVAVEGTWLWSNGDAVTYVNWQPGEPNGGTTANGAEFWSVGTWNDAPSTTPKPYILEVASCSSLNGFTSLGKFGGSCYYRSNNNFTWPNANTDAQVNGGHLVTLNSSAENAFILSTHSSPDPWIGLNDVAVEGTWIWSNGDPITYSNWQPGEPNGGTTANGAEFWSIGTWNDAPTSTPKPYILEIPLCNSVSGFSTLGKFGESCYYRSDNEFTWSNANTDAQAHGGHLVSLNSSAENTFIFSTHTSPDPWIGLNDIAVEGTWVWSNGAALTYSNWQPGEPNGGTTANGAEFWSIGTWNDAPTSTPKPYILELSSNVPGNLCSASNSINPLFGQAIGVPQTSGLWNNTLANSTNDPSTGFGCFDDQSLDHTLWFSFTGDGGKYAIKTVQCSATSTSYLTNGDSQIALYSGNCASPTAVTCNEDENFNSNLFNAYIEVQTTQGVNYSMMVDGWVGTDYAAVGAYCIEVTKLQTTQVIDIHDTDIVVSPNPTSGFVQWKNVNATYVALYDNLGKRIIEQKNPAAQLDVATLPAGIYTLQLHEGGKVYVTKVVKQ